jgi:uncharacterized protein
MTKPLTMNDLIIHNVEFAQSQQTLAGEIDAAKCERLAETLMPSGETLSSNKVAAHISFKLTGAAKQLRNPSLHLHIEAKLPVACQRCLAEMLVHLNLDFDYIICQEMPLETDENDDTDWLEAAPNMNLQELIEDELLLAMPIAPMHDANCSKQNMQSGEKPNPFAALKGLVK